MKRLIPFFVLMTTLLFSCKQEDLDATVWMQYDQTSCADPWTMTPTASHFELTDLELLQLYLATEDVEALELRLVEGGIAEACEACFCKTGLIFEVKIEPADVSQMENLGFSRL